MPNEQIHFCGEWSFRSKNTRCSMSNFRAHLRRDLTASLQPSLKAICTVDVIDMSGTPTEQWDPLWRLWAEKGFNALNGPINADLTGVKTHFLRVEYRDGVYFLESRQYDGFAGLASPVVRTMAIRAPELVGRAAGIMIDRDFGSAGTIEPGSKPDEVRLVLRGGNLISTDKLATAGDVFAIAQIRQTNRPAPPPVRTATGKIINPSPDSTPPPGYTAAVPRFTPCCAFSTLRRMEPAAARSSLDSRSHSRKMRRSRAIAASSSPPSQPRSTCAFWASTVRRSSRVRR